METADTRILYQKYSNPSNAQYEDAFGGLPPPRLQNRSCFGRFLCLSACAVLFLCLNAASAVAVGTEMLNRSRRALLEAASAAAGSAPAAAPLDAPNAPDAPDAPDAADARFHELASKLDRLTQQMERLRAAPDPDLPSDWPPPAPSPPAAAEGENEEDEEEDEEDEEDGEPPRLLPHSPPPPPPPPPPPSKPPFRRRRRRHANNSHPTYVRAQNDQNDRRDRRLSSEARNPLPLPSHAS